MSSSEYENSGNFSSTPLEDLDTRTDREHQLKQEWLDAKKQEEAARADLIQHGNHQGGGQQPRQKNGLKYCNSSKTVKNSDSPNSLGDIGEEEHDEDTPYNDENNSHTIHTPQSASGRTTSPFLNKLRNWLRYRT